MFEKEKGEKVSEIFQPSDKVVIGKGCPIRN